MSPDQSAFRRARAPSACFRMVVKDAAPTSAICTIHEHDRDHSNPVPRCQTEVALAGALLRVAAPLSGPGKPSFLGSGVHHGFRRLNTPRTRLLAPRLVTPTRVARTPSVASSWPAGWRSRLRRVYDTHTGYELTRRTCLREARRRETCLRGLTQQGRLLRSPAKRSALGCAQGAFRRERLSGEAEPCSANRARPRWFPGEGALSTGCSQPVEIAPAPLQPPPFDRASTKLDQAKARALVACSARRLDLKPGTAAPRRLLRSR